MGTTVHYNRIELDNVVTREWHEEVTYDQSGTDPIGVKYRLGFEGIAHVQNLASAVASIGPVAGAAGNLASLWRQIEVALLTPRQTLTVRFGTQLMLTVKPTAADLKDQHRDTDNGPKPHSVKITHVAGSSVVRVQFSIEATKVLCTNKAAGPVLSNRWAINEELDRNFFTTRTIRGRLRLSSSIEAGHAYKGMVVPSLENGFRRERISYTVAENGLDCEYEITDRQVHTATPAPATDMQVSHTESTNDGVTMVSGMSIKLEGAPHIDMRDLLVRAVQIADARLAFLEEEFIFLEQLSITEHLGQSNSVELNIALRRVGENPTDFLTDLGMGNAVQALGSPLALPPLPSAVVGQPATAYNPQISTPPEIYGYVPHGGKRDAAILVLLHCYLQSPCSDEHSIGQFQQRKVTKHAPEGDSPTLVGRRLPALPQGHGSLFSKSHRQNMYTHARVDNEYVLVPLRAHMPIARRVSSLAPGDDTSVVLTLGAPQGQRVIRIDAERVGAWPELPEPLDTYTDGGLRGALLNHKLTPHAPTLAPDGATKIYRVTGTYVYALNRPPRVGETPALGGVPFANLPAKDRKVQSGTIYRQNEGHSINK
jgi:hypothetical protein